MTTATTTANPVVETFWAIYNDPTSTERSWRAERAEADKTVTAERGAAARAMEHGDYVLADYHADLAFEAEQVLDAIDGRYDGLV